MLHESYGAESDVWSAGVVMYVLLAGYPPFQGNSDEAVFRAILESEADVTSGEWPCVSELAKDLVVRMLAKEPSERISLEEVLGE